MAYARLVAPLVEAVKEQSEIVEVQGAKIERLEAENEAQAREIGGLRSRLDELDDLKARLARLEAGLAGR